MYISNEKGGSATPAPTIKKTLNNRQVEKVLFKGKAKATALKNATRHAHEVDDDIIKNGTRGELRQLERKVH